VVTEKDGSERYRGLISREDLIEQPDKDQLALLMREVPTVDREASLTEVARLIVEAGTRRVPVIEDSRLEGIVTVTDVVEAIAEGAADGADEVGELAQRAITTTYEGTPLPVCERVISHARVPYAVVLDDEGSMSGILTEVDIVEEAEVVEGEEDAGESIANEDDEWMWEGIKAVGNAYVPTRNVEIPQAPVREFMSADPVTVTKRRTAREAAQAMLHHDVEQLPLVSGDSLAGVVRDVDLLRALL
jgi:CBS domain-containing protein